MVTTQLSLLPDLVTDRTIDQNDPGEIATEAQWCELLERADAPPQQRDQNYLYCHCGTKFTSDFAITQDEGKHIILICFGCGCFWRTGSTHSEGLKHLPINHLVRMAQDYYPKWRVRA